ncbi:MAG: hypothetical protein QOG03_2244 [Actinomycetota bacterium]|nr:hypothetical protein [Actinomycetota bacterium]
MEVLSSRVLLRPLDPERSHRFYGETLGLHIFREYGEGDHRGVVYFTGIGFLEVSGRAEVPPTLNKALWLQERDVDADHDELVANGVENIPQPRDEPWGLREMWIADPDGIRIAIIQVPEDHPLRRR